MDNIEFESTPTFYRSEIVNSNDKYMSISSKMNRKEEGKDL